jgi:hypothetical protein
MTCPSRLPSAGTNRIRFNGCFSVETTTLSQRHAPSEALSMLKRNALSQPSSPLAPPSALRYGSGL